MTRIESLSVQPDRAGQYYARLSDGTTLRLYRQSIEDFAIMPGRELSEEELESLKAGALALSAKMRAVRIVSAANVSKKDLKERLVRKGEDPDQADAAVKWMEDMAILDDGRTAREVVEKCIARGYGLNRTKQMLYEKKIPNEYWDEALANYPDQQEAIASFLSARLKDPGDRREVKRAVDALLRRGHTYSQIQRALRTLEMENDDDFREE